MAMVSKAGKYKAKAISGEPGVAGTGTDQIAVVFEVTEGPETGNRITWWGYFTEHTFERTVEALRACGWKGDDIDDLAGLSDNVVEIVVESERKDNGERLRVKWVNDLSRGGRVGLQPSLDANAKKSFAERVRGLVRMADHNRVGASGAKPADDDNICF